MNKEIACTEQDTFDVLRRISRDSLESTHSDICETIAHNEWHRAGEYTMLQKKLNSFWYKVSSIFGDSEIITMKLSVDRKELHQIYESSFIGTGWTAEEYGDLIYKEAINRLRLNDKIKKEKEKVIILVYLSVLFLTISLNTLIPYFILSHNYQLIAHLLGPIIIGLIGGNVVARIVNYYSKKIMFFYYY